MFIFKSLIILLEGGMTFEKTENFIDAFLAAARVALFGGGSGGSTGLMHSELFVIFAIIACGFLTVTFYSELIKEATNDTLTTEKLVAALCKLFIGAMMIFFLPEILDIIFKIVQVMFHAAGSLKSNLSTSSATINRLRIFIAHADTAFNKLEKGKGLAELTINLNSVSDTKIRHIFYNTRQAANDTSGVYWNNYADTSTPAKDFNSYWNDYFDGIQMFTAFGYWLSAIIILVVSLVASLGIYFAIAKAIIEFVVYAFFAPIGIINLFGENNRIIGVRYLKKLLAKGITLSVMVILIAVCSSLCSGLIVNTLKVVRYQEANPNARAYITDDNGNIIIDPSMADPNPIITSEGVVQLTITSPQNDLELLFQADVLAKCMIMHIAQLGLLLGAAKLTDELFAT